MYQDPDNALKLKSESIVEKIIDSGLRGRGGAGFPTGLKWKGAAEARGEKKIVICNADEGEPGTFKDRRILDEQFDKVVTGMAACALAIGADEGFIYLRGEYNFLLDELVSGCESGIRYSKQRISFPRQCAFGSGAYVCGEETALIESIEGNRGEPRNKPPFPVLAGYMGRPTVINNVETLAYVTMIMDEGQNILNPSHRDSIGGKVFSISGDASVKGVYELPLGMTIGEFVDIFGDGDTKAVQVGGSSGTCVPGKNFGNTVIGFEGVPTGGSMMLFNSTRSMYHVLKNYLEFFEEESAAMYTVQGRVPATAEGIEAIRSGERPAAYLRSSAGSRG